VEDPALLATLKQRGIALEVCPTSNVCLGVCKGYAGHALPALLVAGVPLSINSDDPPLSGTTLSDELLLLHTAFGLDIETIDELVLNAVRHSFLPQQRRSELETRFRRSWPRCGRSISPDSAVCRCFSRRSPARLITARPPERALPLGNTSTRRARVPAIAERRPNGQGRSDGAKRGAVRHHRG